MTAPARSYEMPAWFALTVKKPETAAAKRRRMADLIRRRVTGGGSISHDELLGGGFSQIEIDTYFPAALEQAGVKRLGDTL
jgi:hypothetical protein